MTDACLSQSSSKTRPSADLENADVPFQVIISDVPNDHYSDSPNNSDLINFSLYRSLISSKPSHKLRHYRDEVIHAASLKSTTAAALLYKSGFHKLVDAARRGEVERAALVDFMCGSGTFLVEGLMMASDKAPLLAHAGGERITAVRWSSAEEGEVWRKLVEDAEERHGRGRALVGRREEGGKVAFLGNDVHASALRLAREGCRNAGFGVGGDVDVTLSEQSCESMEMGGAVSEEGRVEVIGVVNPPWGLRLEGDVEESWLKLAEALRRPEMKSQECWVLSPPTTLSGSLKMKKTRELKFGGKEGGNLFTQYNIFGDRE